MHVAGHRVAAYSGAARGISMNTPSCAPRAIRGHALQELIDTAKRDGTLRPDVTFGTIGT